MRTAIVIVLLLCFCSVAVAQKQQTRYIKLDYVDAGVIAALFGGTVIGPSKTALSGNNFNKRYSNKSVGNRNGGWGNSRNSSRQTGRRY